MVACDYGYCLQVFGTPTEWRHNLSDQPVRFLLMPVFFSGTPNIV